MVATSRARHAQSSTVRQLVRHEWLRWHAAPNAAPPLIAGTILIVMLTLAAPSGIWQAGVGWSEATALVASMAAMTAVILGALATEEPVDRATRVAFAFIAFCYALGRIISLAGVIGHVSPPVILLAAPLVGIVAAAASCWYIVLHGRFSSSEQLAIVLDSGVVFCTVGAISLVLLGGLPTSGEAAIALAYAVVFAGGLGSCLLLSLAITPRRFVGGWIAMVVGFVPLVAGSALVLAVPSAGLPASVLQVSGILLAAYGAATSTTERDTSPRFGAAAARIRSWLPMASVAITPILIISNELLLATQGNQVGGLAVDLLLALILMLTVIRQTTLLRERGQQALELRAAADHTRELMDDLGRSEQRFRSLVTNSSDVFLIIGADGVVSYQSPAVTRVLGYGADDRLGREIFELTHPDDIGFVRSTIADLLQNPGSQSTIELRTKHADGSWRILEATGRNLADDPAVRGIVVNYRDVTERKRLEDQLTHQAFHDPLTGLANRALFTDRVDHALRRRSRGQGVAVLFLDLDDFKTVNDSLGHAAGDAVLREVAARISDCLRDGDTVSRFGGDEFAVLVEDTSADQSLAVARRLLDLLRKPFEVGGRRTRLGASVGVAAADGDADPESMLRNADVAMYVAKTRGKGRIVTFEPAMHSEAITRLEMRDDLEQALERGELHIQYQPIVRLDNGHLDGFEALLRWRHPERGEVPPDRFIPLAEETGLIVPIGRWVLEQACGQAQAWREISGRRISLNVNLSPRQLREPEIERWIIDALEESGLPPRCLVIEITESGIMHEDASRLDAVRGLGVQLALDDFGTGYSSLSYLARFPVDVLKVYRSFIADIETDGAEPTLLRSMIEIAGAMHLRTVAEGIERPDQLERLKELGCDYGQGFLFARPMDAIRAGAMITRRGGVSEEAQPPETLRKTG